MSIATVARQWQVEETLRFYAKVKILPNGCHQWTAGQARGGYGKFSFRGRSRVAHKIIWELDHGPVPDGLELDHLCRNPACVNPLHLEAVTPLENLLRSSNFVATNVAKTHCIHGHPLSGANLRLRNGGRVCNACSVRRKQEWRQRSAA